MNLLDGIGAFGSLFGSVAIPAALLLGVSRLTKHLQQQQQEMQEDRKLAQSQAEALEEHAKALKKQEMASVAQTQLAAQHAVIGVISSKINHEMMLISFYAGQMSRTRERPHSDGRALSAQDAAIGPDGTLIGQDEVRRRMRECGDRIKLYRDELDEARELAVEISLMLMSFYEKK